MTQPQDRRAPPDFVTIGEALAVFIAEPPARLASASDFRCTVAGAESNVAVGLARLGHHAVFMGRVGTDALGEMVLRRLRAEDVDVSHVRRSPHSPTGVIIRDSAYGRPAEVAYYRTGSAGSELEPDDIDCEVLAQCRHVHISGITAVLSPSARAAAEYAAAEARTSGCGLSFDPNLRRRLSTVHEARDAFARLLSFATMIVVSADEATLLAETPDVNSAEEWFLERGASLVVTKRGVEGAQATDGSRRWSCPAHAVSVVDPIGSGDAFAAGFLSRWYQDGDCLAALRAGTVTAALAMTSAADIDALPTRADLEAILAGGIDARR
jgi:2-dehydro-3-deoxygluconokinase